MLTGSHDERDADVRLLRQLRAEAAAELLRGNQRALPRHVAVQSLLDDYETYAALEREFLRTRR